MTTSPSAASIVQRVWNYCNVLRDDGVSYGDYLEQLTYLIFLKIDDENRAAGKPGTIPDAYAWSTLLARKGEDQYNHYRHILEALGNGAGLIATIFRKAQNKIQQPARLARLIDLINSETWLGLDVDIKATIYEGLLQKNAQDVKGGAGQYFTPRELIQALVDVMHPVPGQTICDPASGTAGFLTAAYAHITREHTLDRDQRRHLNNEALHGWEIVDSAARLGLMNLYLHGIGMERTDSPIHVEDSLTNPPGALRFDMVLTNPPFGKKSGDTFITDEAEVKRRPQAVARNDFWASTSNKQLNFLQHIYTVLKVNGRAAAVVPDNVLFEGGAGETIRRTLLKQCDVHTLLRLPTGIFYAQGVKANVLFFDKRPGSAEAQTSRLWIYDLRTNQDFTLKQNPLTRADLADFVTCYNPTNRHQRAPTWSETNPDGRWRAYTYDEILARDKANLDIFWLKDNSLEDSATLPAPDILAAEIIDDLRAALDEFEAIYADLAPPPASDD